MVCFVIGVSVVFFWVLSFSYLMWLGVLMGVSFVVLSFEVRLVFRW